MSEDILDELDQKLGLVDSVRAQQMFTQGLRVIGQVITAIQRSDAGSDEARNLLFGLIELQIQGDDILTRRGLEISIDGFTGTPAWWFGGGDYRWVPEQGYYRKPPCNSMAAPAALCYEKDQWQIVNEQSWEVIAYKAEDGSPDDPTGRYYWKGVATWCQPTTVKVNAPITEQMARDYLQMCDLYMSGLAAVGIYDMQGALDRDLDRMRR